MFKYTCAHINKNLQTIKDVIVIKSCEYTELIYLLL